MQSHNNDVQYGNVLGSVVNIVTKSGTNQFHGSAWEFARSQIFDARNPVHRLLHRGPLSRPGQPAEQPGRRGYADRGRRRRHPFRARRSRRSAIRRTSSAAPSADPSSATRHSSMRPTKAGAIPCPPTPSSSIPPAEELAGDFTGKVSPELIGTVNSAKTGITPNTHLQSVRRIRRELRRARSPAIPPGNPMPLLNPGAGLWRGRIWNSGRRRHALQQDPLRPDRPEAGERHQGLHRFASQELRVHAQLRLRRRSTAWTRAAPSTTPTISISASTITSAKRTPSSARAYMMWDDNNGIVAGTSSITPSPFHVWNIGGAWDHIFTPNLVLSVRGGINSRPATVNPTNPQGIKPETDAGLWQPRRRPPASSSMWAATSAPPTTASAMSGRNCAPIPRAQLQRLAHLDAWQAHLLVRRVVAVRGPHGDQHLRDVRLLRDPDMPDQRVRASSLAAAAKATRWPPCCSTCPARLTVNVPHVRQSPRDHAALRLFRPGRMARASPT